MAEMSHPSMSALPPNVLQNSLLHCERATIESWWTATNQRCALSSDVEWMFRPPQNSFATHSPQKRTLGCTNQYPLWANSGHCRDIATALLSRDSVNANSGWCSGRDTRSPPMNLDYYRRYTPHRPSRDTEKVSRRWLHPTSFCL
jgi:hypothetical protein